MTRRTYDTALSTRIGAIRRELAAAFGVLALVFNLLAGMALAAKPVFVLGSDGQILRFVLCQPIAVTGTGDATEVPADAGSGPQCVFCLPLLSGTAAAAAVADTPARAPARKSVNALPEGLATVWRDHLKGPPPRGPPAI